MKKLTTIILIMICIPTYSQKLKEKLQGEWLCTKILDSNGNEADGKFGKSNEYLKFNFFKGNLSITEAPFDEGIKLPIKFDIDCIDLFPQVAYDLPEKMYTLKLLDGVNLILSTKNQDGELLDYHFINEKNFFEKLSTAKEIIDNRLIVIKHIKLSNETKGANRVAEYRISNDLERLYPSPKFKDNASATFGHYFSINFVFPKNYQLETVSDELIVDFDLDGNGVSNIRVVKGLSEEINSTVIAILEKTRKKWEPLEINGQPLKKTLRFHFIFYLGLSEF